jgi:hypothetical protein
LSRLASTLVAAAMLATVGVLVRAPTHTTPTAPAADVLVTQQPATQQPATQQPATQQPATQQPATPWSPPATLSDCPGEAGTRVVFPSDKPNQATGPGAIVWSASPACPGGGGARVSAIGPDDQPGAGAVPHTTTGKLLMARGPLTATGGPHGEIVIAGGSQPARHGSPGEAVLIQGTASGPFAALRPSGGAGSPLAMSTAYLGDVAVAAPPTTGPHHDLSLHVERFFSQHFTTNVPAFLGAGEGSVQALTLAMDFRGEALAVWAQRGAIYTRILSNRGNPHPPQRLATIGSSPRIAALLSDDNRAIVAWSEQRGTQTSIYIDRSHTGVHFGSPELLERFQDPDGLPSPAASPSLVRMSSESVTLAWAGAAAGHWVIRTAPVDLDGVQAVATLAAPGGDALLADLAPGPADDAVLLWTEPLPTSGGQPDMRRQAIFAARGTDTGPGRTSFGEPQLLAPPGPVSDPTVALDPSSDRAVAAWQGEAGMIDYTVSSPGAQP